MRILHYDLIEDAVIYSLGKRMEGVFRILIYAEGFTREGVRLKEESELFFTGTTGDIISNAEVFSSLLSSDLDEDEINEFKEKGFPLESNSGIKTFVDGGFIITYERGNHVLQ